MNRTLAAAAIFAAAVLPATASADAQKYALDPSHSQIVFSYDHFGFSTNWGMFSGFEGEIMYDEADPAASTVSVSFPVTTMLTGWEARFQHFMSPDFFGGDETVSFTSTAIEVTGDNTAQITGDLTMNGMTKEIVLDAVLNGAGNHPMANKPWLGFSATTTVMRSDFGVGNFAPMVSDEVAIEISIEAGAAS